MDTGRKIMYVGNQFVPSFDRPNARPDRVWNGPGSIVEGVPPIQAHALCQHKDEWQDVTSIPADKLPDAQRAARAKAEERVRVLQNPPDAPNNKRAVDAMTTEELEEELKRRKALDKQAERVVDPTKLQGAKLKEKRPKGEVELSNAVNTALERVLQKVSNSKETTLLDDAGIPTLAAIQEELGYPISEDEYRRALGLTEK